MARPIVVVDPTGPIPPLSPFTRESIFFGAPEGRTAVAEAAGEAAASVTDREAKVIEKIASQMPKPHSLQASEKHQEIVTESPKILKVLPWQ